MNWQRTAAMVFLAAALICAGFAPVAPGWLAGYLGAASGVFTGLAGLFTHPPGTASDQQRTGAVVPLQRQAGQ
jgi:hypothetical protein